MPLLDDYPLDPERGPASVRSERRGAARAWGVIAAALIVAAALAAFFVVRPSGGPGAASTDPAVPPTRADERTARALGPAVEPRELPPLDQTDVVVRELLGALSSRPELAALLATDGLIRSFVAAVDAVANGTAPTAHLRPLAPSRRFAAQARGGRTVIDPASYQRYDGVAATVETLDAEGLARVYSTLRPRMQEAYRELGYPDGNIDTAVERAIAGLLATPLPGRELEVERVAVHYQFVDRQLEQLSPAQKQLLRMGPSNQRMIQGKVRAVAQALGITAAAR